MRKLIAGALGAIALSSAAWIVAASATTNPGGPYQIYIFDSLDGHSIYAVGVGQRAAAARVDGCEGHLLDNAPHIVSDLRARAAREDDEDHFNVVWVEGRGSHVNLGPCGPDEADEEDDPESEPQDTLVVVSDASARQARHLINEIEALPAADRAAMIEAVGLNERRARR